MIILIYGLIKRLKFSCEQVNFNQLIFNKNYFMVWGDPLYWGY